MSIKKCGWWINESLSFGVLEPKNMSWETRFSQNEQKSQKWPHFKHPLGDLPVLVLIEHELYFVKWPLLKTLQSGNNPKNEIQFWKIDAFTLKRVFELLSPMFEPWWLQNQKIQIILLINWVWTSHLHLINWWKKLVFICDRGGTKRVNT